jgi:hypothetical protein
MGCDYYIQTKLVIEYKDITGKLFVIYIDLGLKKKYIDQNNDNNDTKSQNFKLELERKITKNNYNKMLYENNKWVKDTYIKKYENYIKKTHREISLILKVYKNFSAWENPN